MDISPAHEAARIEASRLPALHASLALLQQTDPEAVTRATIEIYGTTRPPAGDPPGGSPVVTLTLTAAAGSVSEELIELTLNPSPNAMITGADESTGTIPVWARIKTPNDSWWADVSVSVEGDGGEITIPQTGTEGGTPVARLFNGATLTLIEAKVKG